MRQHDRIFIAEMFPGLADLLDHRNLHRLEEGCYLWLVVGITATTPMFETLAIL